MFLNYKHADGHLTVWLLRSLHAVENTFLTVAAKQRCGERKRYCCSVGTRTPEKYRSAQSLKRKYQYCWLWGDFCGIKIFWAAVVFHLIQWIQIRCQDVNLKVQNRLFSRLSDTQCRYKFGASCQECLATITRPSMFITSCLTSPQTALTRQNKSGGPPWSTLDLQISAMSNMSRTFKLSCTGKFNLQVKLY